MYFLFFAFRSNQPWLCDSISEAASGPYSQEGNIFQFFMFTFSVIFCSVVEKVMEI